MGKIVCYSPAAMKRFLPLAAAILLVSCGEGGNDAGNEGGYLPSYATVTPTSSGAWQAEYDSCIESKFRVAELEGRSRDRVTPAQRRVFERDCERAANRLYPP